MWRILTAGLSRSERRLTAATWLVGAGLVSWLPGPALAGGEGALPVEAIADGVFVFRGAHEEATPDNLGGIANLAFVVGGEAVAVIDSGGSAAEGRRLLEAIRRVTPLPVRYVVNTHFHPDHVLGNAPFVDEGATVVGHANLPRGLAARAGTYLGRLRQALGDRAEGTEIVPPTLLVRDRLSLDLGGRRSEEHTSELQSLMRISYAVFCLTKKK